MNSLLTAYSATIYDYTISKPTQIQQHYIHVVYFILSNSWGAQAAPATKAPEASSQTCTVGSYRSHRKGSIFM